MPTVDVWFPAVMTLLGTILGAAMEHLYSGRNWLQQQQWSNREKYYTDLLANLTRLRISLEHRSEYFERPGSEYDKVENEDWFKTNAETGGTAFRAIRELTGPARVFLSGKVIDALEELIREQWNAAEHSVCTAEYVTSLLTIVQTAEAEVLKEARHAVAK